MAICQRIGAATLVPGGIEGDDVTAAAYRAPAVSSAGTARGAGYYLQPLLVVAMSLIATSPPPYTTSPLWRVPKVAYALSAPKGACGRMCAAVYGHGAVV